MKSLPLAEIQKQVKVLQLAERFFDSAVLFALFELGVFRILATGKRTLEDLSREIGGSRESLGALLDAAIALKILAKQGNEYTAEEVLRSCLGHSDSPAYMGEWVAFLHSLAGPMFRYHAVVRTGSAPAALYEHMSGDTLPAQRRTAAMDAYARGRGIEIAEHLDFSATRTLLDLGCGPGTYAMAIVGKYPAIRATLLDLPGSIAEAKQLAAERGLLDALEFIAADALSWAADHGYDDVLVSNMLHMLGPSLSLDLLKRCFSMVNPRGRIIIQAQFLNDDRTSPRWPTLLDLLLRVATPQGRNHALGETIDWLKQAGFTDVRHVRFSLTNVNSVLIATRH